MNASLNAGIDQRIGELRAPADNNMGRDMVRNGDDLTNAIAMSRGLVPPEGNNFANSEKSGTFERGNAIALGSMARVSNNHSFSGGLGVGLEEGTAGGRVGLTMSG